MSLRIHIDGRRLLDDQGRQLLLRGINAGGQSKLPPFFPFRFREVDPDAPPFDDALAAYLDRFVDWGLSILRLPFSWEALEPVRGRYDERYLERYLAMARGAGERGLRVIVDFHQDVFARPYHGDGFPLWACPADAPVPQGRNRHWFMGYLSDEGMKRAFDRFWNDEDGLRRAFEAMWRHMARRASEIDAVIGFEPMNEPGWGSANLIDWAKQTLTPFYDHMAGLLGDIAPDVLVLFGTTGPDALSCTTAIERPAAANLVFAPHFYAPEVIMEGTWHGDLRVMGPLGRWAELGEAWNLPVLLGEFGITPQVPGAADYVRANYDRLDELLMHSTMWECSTSREDWNDEAMSVLGPGGEEHATVPALIRPYPLAVAGRLQRFRWDADARRGELSWHAEPGVSEIVTPSRVFPAGVEAVLEGVDGEVAPRAGRLRVMTRSTGTGTLRLSALS